MADRLNILAAGNLAEVAFFVIVAVIFVIAKMAERTSQKKAEQEADEAARRRAAARQQQAPQAPAPPPVLRQVQRPQATARPMPLARPRPVLQYPPMPSEPVASPAPQAMPRPQRAAPPPARTPQPVIEEERATRVSEEVELQTHRLEMEVTQRRRRMETAAPSEADTAALESHLVRIRPAAAVGKRAEVPPILQDLLRPQQAIQAILCHEILSPPKGLRREKEMWDR